VDALPTLKKARDADCPKCGSLSLIRQLKEHVWVMTYEPTVLKYPTREFVRAERMLLKCRWCGFEKYSQVYHDEEQKAERSRVFDSTAYCVADGPGCDGVHDDWCVRGLPHRRANCGEDCLSYVGGGVFMVDTKAAEAAENKGAA